MTNEVKTELMNHYFKFRPCWDPAPPWLVFTKEQSERFLKMELEFQKKELAIEQEKLTQLGNVLGIK